MIVVYNEGFAFGETFIVLRMLGCLISSNSYSRLNLFQLLRKTIIK
jgi:hypothetical protein